MAAAPRSSPTLSPTSRRKSRTSCLHAIWASPATAEGAYTHNDQAVLLCAVRRREIVAVKRLVNEIDPTAFFIVCDAREVLGEGFGEYKPDGL